MDFCNFLKRNGVKFSLPTLYREPISGRIDSVSSRWCLHRFQFRFPMVRSHYRDVQLPIRTRATERFFVFYLFAEVTSKLRNSAAHLLETSIRSTFISCLVKIYDIIVKERKKIRGEFLICRVNRNAKFPVRWYVDRFRNYSKYAELYIKIYIISVRIFAWIQFTLDNFGDIPRSRVEGGGALRISNVVKRGWKGRSGGKQN